MSVKDRELPRGYVEHDSKDLSQELFRTKVSKEFFGITPGVVEAFKAERERDAKGDVIELATVEVAA